MKYFRIAFIFSLMLMIFAGCSKEEIQPDPLSASDEAALSIDDSALKGAEAQEGKHKFVPLKGSFEVHIAAVLHWPPPFPKKQEVLGTGVANHMGNTSVYIYQEWEPDVKPPSPPYTGYGDGNFIFTAANGDQLFAEYFDGTAFHDIDPPVLGSLICEITGGTGRFKDASGTFSWTVDFYPLENTGKAKMEGKIKY